MITPEYLVGWAVGLALTVGLIVIAGYAFHAVGQLASSKRNRGK